MIAWGTAHATSCLWPFFPSRGNSLKQHNFPATALPLEQQACESSEDAAALFFTPRSNKYDLKVSLNDNLTGVGTRDAPPSVEELMTMNAIHLGSARIQGGVEPLGCCSILHAQKQFSSLSMQMQSLRAEEMRLITFLHFSHLALKSMHALPPSLPPQLGLCSVHV